MWSPNPLTLAKFAQTFGFDPARFPPLPVNAETLMRESLATGKTDLDLVANAPAELIDALRAKGLLDD